MGVIDWDGSGPGSPMWDLAYAAQSFVPLEHGGKPLEDAARLRFLVDGYGPDQLQRCRLPQMIVNRTRAMADLLENSVHTGRQPWARLYAEGHETYWRQAAKYIETHLKTWQLPLTEGFQP